MLNWTALKRKLRRQAQCVSFREAVFYGEANFQKALFRLNADFSNVEFSGSRTSFENATFGEEYLSDQTTHFRNASFAGEETSFYEVEFWT